MNSTIDAFEMFRTGCEFADCADFCLKEASTPPPKFLSYASPAVVNAAFACKFFEIATPLEWIVSICWISRPEQIVRVYRFLICVLVLIKRANLIKIGCGFVNTSNFLETMINVLKFDSKFKDKKDILLPILRRCYLINQPQYEFVYHGRTNQHYENVEIRVPVPLLNQTERLQKDLNSLVAYIYEESDEYALGKVLIKPQILQAKDVEYKEHDVVFSEIQETIVQGIRNAKYTIWAAVAWLSNQSIIDELVARKKHGVHVRLVISEEEGNQPYYEQLSQNFDLVLIPHYGWNDWNRMHDKFCIIDFEYVMHGSYNWTKTANFNNETLATALDRDFVKKFADEFLVLYNKGHII